jgi:hypothetical protein
MKQLAKPVYIYATLLFALGFAALAAQVPQPGIMTYQPAASSFLAAIPGEVIQVTGTNFMLGESFSDFRNIFSTAFLDNLTTDYPLETRVESRSTLYFIIPAEAPCGEQHFYLKNGQNLSDTQAPPSSPYPLFIECTAGGIGPQAVRPHIDSISSQSAKPGDEIAIYGNDFAFNYAIQFDDGLLSGIHWVSKNEVRFQIPLSASCSVSHSFRIQNRIQHWPSLGSHLPSESNTISFMPGCSGGGSSAPPRGGDRTGLLVLDKNGDCHISDSEFFASVDEWIATRITDQLFFDAVDGWIGQSNICLTSSAQAAKNLSVEILSNKTSNIISFTWNQSLQNVRVEIYSSSGKVVFRESSSKIKILWNLRDETGRPVPNGVYFYRLIFADETAQLHSAGLKMLVVLR